VLSGIPPMKRDHKVHVGGKAFFLINEKKFSGGILEN